MKCCEKIYKESSILSFYFINLELILLILKNKVIIENHIVLGKIVTLQLTSQQLPVYTYNFFQLLKYRQKLGQIIEQNGQNAEKLLENF